jgi:hypothetical protein
MRAISGVAAATVLCVACDSAGSALSEPTDPPLVNKAAKKGKSKAKATLTLCPSHL